MKNKTVVTQDIHKKFKASKNWQLLITSLLMGGIAILTEFIFYWSTGHTYHNNSLLISFFLADILLTTCFVLTTLLLPKASYSIYGLSGQDLLKLRTSHNKLTLSTQIQICLFNFAWAALFMILHFTTALICLVCLLIGFMLYQLHHSIRLCFDKKYMMEKVQRLVDLSIYDACNLEERYMIELLTKESLHNAKIGQTKYLVSDLTLLLYLYTHTEKLQMKQLIDAKLEYLTCELLPILPLQLISNEILKKLEDSNNAQYTKLVLLITQKLLRSFETFSHHELIEQNLFQTLYTLFRPITDRTYLENLSTTLLSCETLIENNDRLSIEQKEYWIEKFYETLSQFSYLPETLKSLNFTCLMSVVLKKIATSSTQYVDLLLNALQKNEQENKNMTMYAIACVHVLLYAYHKKYQLTTFKDWLVTLPTAVKSYWNDLENHLMISQGMYLKYYEKIMEQITLIANNLNEPTFITYANEFFLYYWVLQADKNYSIRYDKMENVSQPLTNMIDVIEYTEQQNFEGIKDFQTLYSLDMPFQTSSALKIIDYIRNEYITFVYDRQRNMQTEILSKGIDRICTTINNQILTKLSDIPFSKPNLNINDQNTFTLKFLITNEDLLDSHLQELLNLVNDTYQQTMLKTLKTMLSNGLDLKPFYYRGAHENLSYITNWLHNFNCDCRSKLLNQNIDVLDNPKEECLSTFEKEENALTDVSSLGLGSYVYLNSDKINIFNCPLSTSIRELSHAELQKVLQEHKSGKYYQIENFLSDQEDANKYYSLTHKMLEVTYSMEAIIEPRAGFEVLFGVDGMDSPQPQEKENRELDDQPLANQTTLDSLLGETTKK